LVTVGSAAAAADGALLAGAGVAASLIVHRIGHVLVSKQAKKLAN
jgi:hypothetical protein